MASTQTQTRTAFSPDTSIRPGGLSRRASSHHSSKKPWQQNQLHRRPSFRSSTSKSRVQNDPEEEQRLSRQASRGSTRSKRRTPKWWKIRLFRGMIDDVKRRAPFYLSDWTDAWDYRVVPATVYMYFAKYDLRYGSNSVHSLLCYHCGQGCELGTCFPALTCYCYTSFRSPALLQQPSFLTPRSFPRTLSCLYATF